MIPDLKLELCRYNEDGTRTVLRDVGIGVARRTEDGAWMPPGGDVGIALAAFAYNLRKSGEPMPEGVTGSVETMLKAMRELRLTEC